MKLFVFHTQLCVLAGALIWPVCLSAAALEWDVMKHEHQAPIGEEAFEAEFRFTNTSGEVVTIESVKTTCGCTAAELGEKNYGPGESGAIKTRFSYGSREGGQAKHVQVIDSNGDRYTLTLQVEIPVPVEIVPRVLLWRAGENYEPKIVDVSIHPEFPFDLREIKVEGEGYEATWKGGNLVGGRKRYQLSVTPLENAEVNGRAVVTIFGDAPNGAADRYRVFAAVRSR